MPMEANKKSQSNKGINEIKCFCLVQQLSKWKVSCYRRVKMESRSEGGMSKMADGLSECGELHCSKNLLFSD